MVKNLWRPAVPRYFIGVIQSDGATIQPVQTVEKFGDGRELDVPGTPAVIYQPGHIEGEVAFYLPDRDVLFYGYPLATVDFGTWQGTSPQLLQQWLNIDPDQARASLADSESLGDVRLLPGHGDSLAGDLSDSLR